MTPIGTITRVRQAGAAYRVDVQDVHGLQTFLIPAPTWRPLPGLVLSRKDDGHLHIGAGESGRRYRAEGAVLHEIQVPRERRPQDRRERGAP